MATQTFPVAHGFAWRIVHARSFELFVPAARALFGAIFLSTAFTHLSPYAIEYAASEGVPLPEIFVSFSALAAVVGAVSVILGYKARYGAAMLALFLLPVTLTMHRFWSIPDPRIAMLQEMMFMKNISLIGGAMLLAYHGAGPFSMDAHTASRDDT